MFVNNDIRKEMYKGADANVDAQFKKLFIYHMENVSILFADIKVSTVSWSDAGKYIFNSMTFQGVYWVGEQDIRTGIGENTEWFICSFR